MQFFITASLTEKKLLIYLLHNEFVLKAKVTASLTCYCKASKTFEQQQKTKKKFHQLIIAPVAFYTRRLCSWC